MASKENVKYLLDNVLYITGVQFIYNKIQSNGLNKSKVGKIYENTYSTIVNGIKG